MAKNDRKTFCKNTKKNIEYKNYLEWQKREQSDWYFRMLKKKCTSKFKDVLHTETRRL